MSTSMTTPGVAGWIQFNGPEPAAAQAFYAKVMGWEIAELPMQDGSSHPAIMVGDAPIGGFSAETASAASWDIYITVPDVDKSFATAIELGATAVVPPMDMPGIGRTAKIIDPQGAAIRLITYESMQA